MSANNDSKSIFFVLSKRRISMGPTHNFSLRVDGKVVAAGIHYVISFCAIDKRGRCVPCGDDGPLSCVIVVIGAISKGSPRAVPTLAAGPSVGSIKTKESSRLGATCH